MKYTASLTNKARTCTVLSLVAATLTLSACIATAPKLDIFDPLQVSSAINVQRDDFKKVTNFRGPNVAQNRDDNVFLRAWRPDSTGKVDFQIYVSDYYGGGWRFYNTAYDDGGNRLDTTTISRNVIYCSYGSCTYREDLGLNVSRAYLEKKQDSGLTFQVSGQAGNQVFFIPGGYIKAFLSEANDWRTSSKK